MGLSLVQPSRSGGRAAPKAARILIGSDHVRSSKRIAEVLLCALLGIALQGGMSRPAHADDVPGGDEVAVEPAPESPATGESGPTLADLGVTDSPIDRPGLEGWVIDTAVVSTISWGATLAFNEKIREGVMNSSGEQWLENISQAPEWNDGSDAVTNYVSHPLLGATWFLTYRSRGHGFITSSLGLIFQSFWFEYVIEGPHKVPSARDLLFTPLLGIPIGYGLDSLSVYLLKKDDKPLRYLGYVFNPFRLLPTAKNHALQVSLDPAKKSFSVSGRF